MIVFLSLLAAELPRGVQPLHGHLQRVAGRHHRLRPDGRRGHGRHEPLDRRHRRTVGHHRCRTDAVLWRAHAADGPHRPRRRHRHGRHQRLADRQDRHQPLHHHPRHAGRLHRRHLRHHERQPLLLDRQGLHQLRSGARRCPALQHRVHGRGRRPGGRPLLPRPRGALDPRRGRQLTCRGGHRRARGPGHPHRARPLRVPGRRGRAAVDVTAPDRGAHHRRAAAGSCRPSP